MDILGELTAKAEGLFSSRSDVLRIDNIIVGQTIYTMKACERIFTDMNFCMSLLEDAYGFTYHHSSDGVRSLHRYVNRNAFEVLRSRIPLHLRIAIVDALYCLLNKERAVDGVLSGTLRQKATQRAEILLNSTADHSNIVLLGAVTEIIEYAESKGCTVNIFDLQPQKAGLQFGSSTVRHGDRAALRSCLATADCVIATGMVFASGTADDVFDLAHRSGARLILYMQSGANFGAELLDYGADVVFAEYFPFYDFFGNTKYSLFEGSRPRHPDILTAPSS